MRKIVFLILCSTLLLSCNNIKQTSFSGEILNYNNEDIYIDKATITNDVDSINVFDGKFSERIDTENAQIKYLIIGNNLKKVFLSPNKSLEMYCDLSNVDSSLIFKGDLAEENNILHQITKELRNIDYSRIYYADAEPTLQYLDSVSNSTTELFHNLTAEKQLGKDFSFLVENMIKYEIINMKFHIGFLKNLYADSTFHQMIDNEFVEDYNLMEVGEYKSFVVRYVAFKSRTLLAQQSEDDKFTYTEAKIKSLDLLNNKPIKDYVIYDLFKMILMTESIEEFEKYSAYFYENNHNQEFIDDINRRYADKKLLSPGNSAPDFTYFDIDSTQVSLSDFRGKYVFIDFWSIGCGGCRYDLPHLAKLQEEYKDENIVFISVSLDSKWEQWEGVVKSEMSDGIALFAGEGYDKGAFKDYQIKAIPTYVFVDKNGKFIDSRAPRPSTQKVRELFDAHIK